MKTIYFNLLLGNVTENDCNGDRSQMQENIFAQKVTFGRTLFSGVNIARGVIFAQETFARVKNFFILCYHFYP